MRKLICYLFSHKPTRIVGIRRIHIHVVVWWCVHAHFTHIYIYMNYDWCHKSLFQLGQLYRIANTSHCFCLDILLTTEAVCRLHNEFKCSERCYIHTILKINWNKISVLVWYIITVQTFIFNMFDLGWSTVCIHLSI